MNSQNKYQSAFTLVEMVVVIVVVVVLSTLIIVGYAGWRDETIRTEVQSQLKQAVAAMENSRNFGSGYPTALPSSYKQSKGTTITYKSGDATTFCLDAASNEDSTIVYFANSTTSRDPSVGSCP